MLTPALQSPFNEGKQWRHMLQSTTYKWGSCCRDAGCNIPHPQGTVYLLVQGIPWTCTCTPHKVTTADFTDGQGRLLIPGSPLSSFLCAVITSRASENPIKMLFVSFPKFHSALGLYSVLCPCPTPVDPISEDKVLYPLWGFGLLLMQASGHNLFLGQTHDLLWDSRALFLQGLTKVIC